MAAIRDRPERIRQVLDALGELLNEAPAPPPQQERLTLTLAQVEAQLGVSRSVVRRLRREGLLPVVHAGGRVLVRVSAVERLLEEAER